MINENLSFKEYVYLCKDREKNNNYKLLLQEYLFYIFLLGVVSFLSFSFLKKGDVIFGGLLFLTFVIILYLIEKNLKKIFIILNILENKNIVKTIIFYQIFFLQLSFVIILFFQLDYKFYKLILIFGLINFFLFYYVFYIFSNREIFIQFLKKENGEIDRKIIKLFFPINFIKSKINKIDFKNYFQDKK